MSSTGTYALFTLGAQSFCVADAHVVQAVPYPADITRIPRTTGALHGVFMHRGQLVPLVDLGHWMGQSEVSGKPAGEALVLKANGVVLAPGLPDQASGTQPDIRPQLVKPIPRKNARPMLADAPAPGSCRRAPSLRAHPQSR